MSEGDLKEKLFKKQIPLEALPVSSEEGNNFVIVFQEILSELFGKGHSQRGHTRV